MNVKNGTPKLPYTFLRQIPPSLKQLIEHAAIPDR